jgi:drug/metabolite transporter (DMT)-like permease
MVAAWSKADDPGPTRALLLSLLPGLRRWPSRRLGALVAAIVTAEVAVATALLVAPRRLGVAVVFAAVSVAFVIVSAMAWRRRVACGCFGRHSRATSRRVAIVRASIVAGIAGVGLMAAVQPAPGSADVRRAASVACIIAALLWANERPPSLEARARTVLHGCAGRERRRALAEVRTLVGRELPRLVLDHADLAWWAGAVDRVAASAAPTYVLAVPGRDGQLRAVLSASGPAHLVLVTPGGPVTGTTAVIEPRQPSR